MNRQSSTVPKYGEKLREFGVERFGTIKAFAEALEMKPPSLQKYLQGNISPGEVLLNRLRKMGCDLNWLFDEEGEKKIMKVDKEFYKLRSEILILREELKEKDYKLKKINKLMEEK